MDTQRSKLPGYEQALFRDHGPDLREGRDMEPGQLPLYSRQDAVPLLPLPTLDETFETLLASLRPHASGSELQEVKRKLADFSRRGGLAETLQERLRLFQESRQASSWLSEMWNEVAYLGYRDSVAWNVSYYLQFKDEADWAMGSPVHRAARFVHHALSFREQLVNGRLPPDLNRGQPMCMSQHKFLFNTCRVPGREIDSVRTYAPDLFGHIVVARNNRFYAVDVVDRATDTALSVEAIETGLAAIVEDADSRGTDSGGIGILTAMDRDTWHSGRECLIRQLKPEQCETNRAALTKIESSILALCLDDDSPQSRNDVGRALIHSDGRNRFWDKSIQLVFFANGKGGCICEHAMTDGTTTTGMINYVLEKMSRDESAPECGERGPSARWQAIDFDLDDQLQIAVEQSATRFDSLMATKDLESIEFRDFGKETIKSLGISPDAFVQLAIQLAHYRVFDRFRGTYESTQTRSFLHGRTEVTRSLTDKAAAFCMAFDTGAVAPLKCDRLMRAATDAHSAYISRAAHGRGCDRHLFGLRMMMRDGESAELYSDEVYQRAATWSVSSSAMVGELIDGWGFGEVVPDGIGIGYQIKRDSLFFTVSSGTGRAREIVDHMLRSLREMRQLAANCVA